jgi:hypothetical protein
MILIYIYIKLVKYYPTNFPFNVPLVAGEKPPFPPLYG